MTEINNSATFKDFPKYELKKSDLNDIAKAQQQRLNPHFHVQQPIIKQQETNLINNSNLAKIKDEFLHAKKSRGLFERFYDFCKNITGIGTGYKKIEQDIIKVQKGQISEGQLQKEVENYSKSNKNANQSFGDIMSGLVTLGVFYKMRNFFAEQVARSELKAESIFFKIFKATSNAVKETGSTSGSSMAEKLTSLFKSKGKSTILMLPVLFLTGAFVKYVGLKINRIGSKEFDVENKNNLSKHDYKAEKQLLKSEKRWQSFKNFLTGGVNGMLAPITAICGGIVGVPLYILGILGLRHASNNDNNKSFKDTLFDNALFNTLAIAALAVPAIKKANFAKVLDINLVEVVKKLKDKKLIEPDFNNFKPAFSELEEILTSSSKIRSILKSRLSVENRIRKLTEENIFAVKFKQIASDGDELAKALKENCPATRSLKEATAEIKKLLGGDNKYTVTKLLGTGTIAETYLAKDSSGKEVVIKILKKGISKEKIEKDYQEFIKLIKKSVTDEKKQKYLLDNAEEMAQGILKEVDLKNEKAAAEELAKVTRLANVAVPIEAKDGIYIMEKAQGISVSSLGNYIQTKAILDILKAAEAKIQGKSFVEKTLAFFAKRKIRKQVKILEAQMKKIKASSPNFEDFNLSEKEITTLANKYIGILTEQFVKLDKNGKIIHGDLHPGNLFIDVNALKDRKNKIFTLIDTGNTIRLTQEQAKDALRLTSFINNGNYKDIARMVTEDAILPNGMTKEKLRELVETELKEYFTDTEHTLGKMTIDRLYEITDSILAKHNVIPSRIQASLNKSRNAAGISFRDLINSLCNKTLSNLGNGETATPAAALGSIKNMASLLTTSLKEQKTQEWKNMINMLLHSPREYFAYIRNKNMLPTNSQEHLIYKFKQDMIDLESKIKDQMKK